MSVIDGDNTDRDNTNKDNTLVEETGSILSARHDRAMTRMANLTGAAAAPIPAAAMAMMMMMVMVMRRHRHVVGTKRKNVNLFHECNAIFILTVYKDYASGNLGGNFYLVAVKIRL